jgi:ATP-dependent exoDNAse (exonuclease V) beta subunit
MTAISTPVQDAGYREAALDPERSFIVQAPAGSGKTELLIQRYLRLLARVEHPEEIISITFTRKAAAEMRSRVIAALERAAEDDPPQSPHLRKTWDLARAARRRDGVKNWEIAENPGRLKIQTIDALCAAIVRNMPYLSSFGAPPSVVADAVPLYRRAARNTLAEVEAGSRWSGAIEALIRHLDNQLGRLEALIASLLERRDQWLRHIAGRVDPEIRRKSLEEGLEAVVTEALEDCRSRLLEKQRAELPGLACFAGKNLAEQAVSNPIAGLAGLETLPPARPENFDQWLGLCELLLTKQGGFRRQTDKRQGFPAPGSAGGDSGLKRLYADQKEAMKELLSDFSCDMELCGSLEQIRFLPAPAYADQQWEILEALIEMLQIAVAHLEITFQAEGAVDFTEVALRAATALGSPEEPTDLALDMDHRIQHILIDEFQDTSITQFQLLEKLTMGWEPGDKRSFFAVGDPMQSIYGFREAEVGLFLKAWSEGIGTVDLESIPLSVNFRSQEGIVDWINASFPEILPPQNDSAAGAVAYSPSASALPASEAPAVSIHPVIPADREQEGLLVLKLIREALRTDPNGNIALLVRNRSHLEDIIRVLKNSRISFSAVEIEPLKNRPMVRDLISLARALSHPADRIAWLALLRAPWCGLRLFDLHALAVDAPRACIPDLLKDPERLDRLSRDGHARALRVSKILETASSNRQRRSLRRLVEGTWLRLGGPAACFSEADLEDAGAFFRFLDEAVEDGVLRDVTGFEEKLGRLFARPDPSGDDRIQIMTIHKAKGLEFDTVILPGLDRPPPAEPERLLMWLERPGRARSDLLLAPMAAAGEKPERTYTFIRRFERTKRGFEDTRLLYVAATRAKKRLHLVGGAHADRDCGKPRQPDSRSLLSSLWSVVSGAFENAVNTAPSDAGDTGAEGAEVVSHIRRLPPDWQMPDVPAGIRAGRAQTVDFPSSLRHLPPFDWAGEMARRVGTVVHRWLHMICKQGMDTWGKERVSEETGRFYRDLRQAGVGSEMLDEAVDRVATSLSRTLEDEMGRWILSDHQEGACELALSGFVDREIVNVVLDRTFIDHSGMRWIIDYKTGLHAGGSLEAFLDAEKLRYEPQMQMYGKLMQAMEKRPVCLLLYYPQLKAYRKWMLPSQPS